MIKMKDFSIKHLYHWRIWCAKPRMPNVLPPSS